MKFGLPISLGLHGLVLAGGLVLFSKNITPLEQGRVIPVELLDVGEMTNVSAAAPDVQPDTLRETLPDPQIDTSPDSPPSPAPAPAVDKPDKADVAPAAPPTFDLDRFASIVDQTRTDQPDKNQQVALQSESNFYEFAEVSRAASGEGTGLTVSMLDRLQTEMLRCWRESRDAVNPEKLVVQFRVRLFPDGYVDSVEMLRETGSGPYAAIARQRAAAAIKKCEPYDFLPADKYSGWKDMTLSFRPRA